jgi:hypothetical protein
VELQLNLESKVLGTARPDATLPIINPTYPETGLNPSLNGKKTETNYLSSGAAFRVALELHSIFNFSYIQRTVHRGIFL